MIEELIISQEFGADEAIEDKPINRYEVAKQAMPKKTTTARKINTPSENINNSRKIANSCKDLESLKKSSRIF